MRFTTPSIASAGKPFFAIREVFVPEAWVPSLLLFRHPPLRFDSIFSDGYRSCLKSIPKPCGFGFFERLPSNALSNVHFRLREGSRDWFARAPVKETRTLQSENRFPRCDARAFEPSSSHRLCRRSLEKTCAISLAAVSKCKTLTRCFGFATPS